MKIDISETPEEKRQYVKTEEAFAPVPYRMVIGKPVSYGAVCLFAVLYSFCDWRTMKTFVSQKTLAKELDCTVQMIRKWQKELEETGWITIRRTGRTNYITLKVKQRKKVKKLNTAS